MLDKNRTRNKIKMIQNRMKRIRSSNKEWKITLNVILRIFISVNKIKAKMTAIS